MLLLRQIPFAYAAASCSKVTNLTSQPAPNDPANSTTTSFVIKGQLDCTVPPPNDTGLAPLKLMATNDSDSSTHVPKGNLVPDATGSASFTVSNVVFGTTGNWTIQIQYFNGIKATSLNGKTLSITIVAATKSLKCGDATINPASPENQGGKDLCPSDCPASDISNLQGQEQWVCKSKELQQQLASCTPIPIPDIVKSVDHACSPLKVLVTPTVCNFTQDNSTQPLQSWNCTDGLESLCYDGTKTQDNIKCQTDQPKPTPIPPPPPCVTDLSATGSAIHGCDGIHTPLAQLPTDPAKFVPTLFRILLSLSGGIVLLILIFSGYQIMTSQGDPEKIKAARERITSAFIGILFLIFSIVILTAIGVTIFAIPGFGQ